MSDATQPILKAEHLGITFGGLKAVSNFNMTINKGELIGLIGPNGAGKTTVFNLLTGVYKPTEGEFWLDGTRMNGKKTYQVVRAGIARTFQNIRLFKQLTVEENVLVAFDESFTYHMGSAIFRTPGFWKQENEMHEKAIDLLRIFNLEGLATTQAANLPYGQQRKLEIARALATGMKLLLLDEPAAGKTTTLHTITGLVPAKSGNITYDGHDLLKTYANKIVTLGMAHVPEGRHVFTRMSVQENLEMGAFSLKDQSSLGKDLEMVFDYFPRLKERRRQLAGTLSGGEQQMVAMGRALMSHPKTILMDEPSMGLSPLLVKEIFDIIVTLRKRGITVLLVEQNAKMALSIADRAYVLETGKITMEGKASDLLHDEKVRKAYLGA